MSEVAKWYFDTSIINLVNCNKKELSPNDMEKALMVGVELWDLEKS